MYVGNLPTKAAQKLSEITDIVRAEQYMDFVTNRRFRNTLLCKNTQAINRNVGQSILDDAYIQLQATPKVGKETMDFTKDDIKVSFDLIKGAACTTNSTSHAAVLYALSEQVEFISISQLFEKAKKLYPKFDAQTHGPQMKSHLVELIFKGLAKFSFTEPHYVGKISNKPKMFKIARYQALNNASHVVNCENDSVTLDDALRFVISKADGTNTKDEIVKEFALWLKSNGNSLEQDGKTVTDEKLSTKLLGDIVERSLQFALTCGLLVE
jgi:methyltransferase-like protein